MAEKHGKTRKLAVDSDTKTGDTDLQFPVQRALGQVGVADQLIGRYRLICPIGHGGMGVVWRASQEEPVKREVALKLVGSNVGVEAIARFEAERQAIAMMDHPNIATIFDAGTTDEGNPYFVMELVKGIPLDQYCNNHKLSIEERLRLTIPVCRAVQHAHQKGIIHRDLKHSNILVAYDGEKPIPKVIDFGLAKALGNEKTLTDKTVFTEFGKVVGTIHYMSPEQADSDGKDVDTRSDIYSLGVVLFKLLTGKTPLQVGDGELSFIAALNAVREQESVAPSKAVSEDAECASWVRSNTPDKKFGEKIKGDLDSIVLKALEKDRRSRYETANGLALDIERYLNHQPVLAQSRNTMYAVRKFIQRNRKLVASIAAFIGLLIVGIVCTTSSLLYALSETERANQSTLIAKQETTRAKTAEGRAKSVERLTNMQLSAQLHKSAASHWEQGNAQSAWQTLRKIETERGLWISRYLANEMSSGHASDVFYGHAHYVLSVDVSPKGDFCLSGGADDTIRLWNIETGEVVYRKLFSELVTHARFSGDQKYFAVADRSNIVTLFETSTGERLKEFGPYDQDISAISFHPQQPLVAVGLRGKDTFRLNNDRKNVFEGDRPAPCFLIDIESGETLWSFESHPSEVTSLEFNARGDWLASGCMDGKVRLWTRASGESEKNKWKLSKTIDAHSNGVLDVDLSEDGQQVASGGKNKIASLWDAKTGAPIAQFAGHSSSILSVDLSPCGQLLTTASNDSSLIVWNSKGEQIASWLGHTGAVNEAKFTPDGKRVVSVSDDQTVRCWSTKHSGTTVTHDFEDSYEIWRSDFSPDKSLVAVASESGSVFLIDASTGEVKHRLPHGEPVLAIKWLNDGKLVTAGHNVGLCVWDTENLDSQPQEPSVKVDIPNSWDISASSNEDRLLVACEDSKVHIFETKTFSETGVLDGHVETVASARFSADDKRIITASDDNTIGLWDAETGKRLRCFEGHGSPVWRAVFSPVNPNLIASSSAMGEIFLWDLATSKRVPVTFSGHSASVAGLTFSPDGTCLVSACDDGTVRIWEVSTGVEMFVFQQQPLRPMIDAKFSDDGQSLVTTGVGFVAVRHASEDFTLPYLHRDAIADSIKHDELVITDDISKAALKTIVTSAKKVLRHYPSFEAWSNLGIAQYRLGQFEEAEKSLSEALRLEKILYGMPDLRPWIEGYLAMAHAETGNVEQAREIQKLLDEEEVEWGADAEYQHLKLRVETAVSRCTVASE